MQPTSCTLLVVLAVTAAAAPVDNPKRQLIGSGLPSLALPSSGALPTGLPGSGSGFGGLGSSTGGLGSSSSGGFGGLSSSTGGLGSSTGSGIGGLSSLGSSTATKTIKERQDLGSFGSLTPGVSGSSSGLSGLGSFESSSGSSSLGSLTGSTTSGTSGTDSSSSSAASGGCKALTFIFARGTGEIGTMGTVVGPPVATALANKLGADKVSAQGVDYPADAGGNANLGASGGPAMAKLAKSVMSSCPNSKVVLSGYSQGGMVVHNALSDQGVDGSKVAAVVAFGDPLNGQAFKGVATSKVKEFCGGTDSICDMSGSTTGTGGHLSYGDDADAAASFIVSATGLSSRAGMRGD